MFLFKICSSGKSNPWFSHSCILFFLFPLKIWQKDGLVKLAELVKLEDKGVSTAAFLILLFYSSYSNSFHFFHWVFYHNISLFILFNFFQKVWNCSQSFLFFFIFKLNFSHSISYPFLLLFSTGFNTNTTAIILVYFFYFSSGTFPSLSSYVVNWALSNGRDHI